MSSIGCRFVTRLGDIERLIFPHEHAPETVGGSYSSETNVHLTTKCDRCFVEEYFMRSEVSKALAGPVIELGLNAAQLSGRNGLQVGAALDVLTDQSIGVFASTALSGVAWIGEVDSAFQAGGNRLISGEFGTVVESNRPTWQWPQSFDDDLGVDRRPSRGWVADQHVAAGSLDQRGEPVIARFGEHAVALPVAEGATQLHRARTGMDARPIGRQAATALVTVHMLAAWDVA